MADTNSPDWISPAFEQRKGRWQMCRDVRGGTAVFRHKASTYLPKFEVESERDWQARIQMTFVVDFLEQAVGTFVGLGLRHDPQLGDEVPDQIQEDWEDLDGEGNHGAVVAQMALEDALTDGHVVLFTDKPTVDQALNADQEAKLGIRPYVVRIPVDRIRSAPVGMVGGRRMIVQFVFEEESEEPDGLFGSKCERRFRVFRQAFEPMTLTSGAAGFDLTKPYVQWEVWEEIEDKQAKGGKTLVLTGSGRMIGPTQIPVAIVYGGTPEGVLLSKPPLEGLAYSNVRWAQVMSDRAATLHRTGIPVPVIIGELAIDPVTGKPPQDLVLSASRPLQIGLGGDFKIVEAQGTALDQTRLELEEWEKRMGSQSLAMLQRDIASAETATAHRLNRGREESKLARALRSLEDALELSLQFMADYRRLDRELVDVTVRRDFGDIVDPSTLELLSRLEERSQLTLTRLLTELQRASVLSNDFDPAAEVAELKRELGSEPMGAVIDTSTGLGAAAKAGDAKLAAEAGLPDPTAKPAATMPAPPPGTGATE